MHPDSPSYFRALAERHCSGRSTMGRIGFLDDRAASGHMLFPFTFGRRSVPRRSHAGAWERWAINPPSDEQTAHPTNLANRSKSPRAIPLYFREVGAVECEIEPAAMRNP